MQNGWKSEFDPRCAIEFAETLRIIPFHLKGKEKQREVKTVERISSTLGAKSRVCEVVGRYRAGGFSLGLERSGVEFCRRSHDLNIWIGGKTQLEDPQVNAF